MEEIIQRSNQMGHLAYFADSRQQPFERERPILKEAQLSLFFIMHICFYPLCGKVLSIMRVGKILQEKL